MGTDTETGDDSFNFESHGRNATNAFKDRRRFFEDCALVIESILRTAVDNRKTQVHSIESRAKTIDSFYRKASRASPVDATKPKYPDPLNEITDLAGARVITFFLDTLDEVDQIINDEFMVTEKTNKSSLLEDEEKLGYQSVHYLVSLKKNRTDLSEYSRYKDAVVEIQVRTILQHAWAEIEHDIQYKSVEALPTSVRRRFLTLAGLIEIADREFQAISTEEKQVRTNARKLIASKQFEQVEITPDALKEYLDSTLGPDGRMADLNYGWNARTLKRLGFSNLKQVDECISGYNDDQVSRTIWGRRQGQLQRFEDMLLAAMGESDYYWTTHTWGQYERFVNNQARKLTKLKAAGIEVKSYSPSPALDSRQ